MIGTPKRVPGAKSYQAVSDGLRQIGSSNAMGAECLAAAKRIESAANAAGPGKYSSGRASVRAGWNNTPRAGASVTEEQPASWLETRDRTLERVTELMRVRSDGR